MNTVAKESAATRSQGHLETLMAGVARIDLEGNQVGAVTASDEEDAKRKIAKAARRVTAKADRKAASQAAAKPVAERAGQQNQIPEAKSQAGAGRTTTP